MIRSERDLVSIPVEKAVYCENLQAGIKLNLATLRSLRFGKDCGGLWRSPMSGEHPAPRRERIPVPIHRLWFAAGVHSDSSEGWHRRFLLDELFRLPRMSAELARKAAAAYAMAARCGAALSHVVRIESLRSRAAHRGRRAAGRLLPLRGNDRTYRRRTDR